MISRKQATAAALGVLLALGSASPAAAGQEAAARPANVTNKSGPTLTQIREAPINFQDSRLRAYASKKLGPLTQIGGGYRYALPDETLVVFRGCDADQRCDQATFLSRVGKGDARQLQAVDEEVGACSLLTSLESEQIRAASVRAFPGEIVVTQRIVLGDETPADRIHRAYTAFAGCANEAREDFARGLLNAPIAAQTRP